MKIKRLLLSISCLLLFTSCFNSAKKDPFQFDGKMSREVLENYLSRSITMSEFLVGDSFAVDGGYPCRDRDIRLIKNTGAKFIGRSIFRWRGEEALNDPDFLGTARELIQQVHNNDSDVIFQAAVFEAVYPEINAIRIPEWTFRALGLPVENRNFSYRMMLDKNGKYVNHWGDGSVPDITRVETQLWFIYLIGSYIDIGIEAIHLGQVALMGMNDPELNVWSSFMKKVRDYTRQKARRHFVLFDAHTPEGGMVVNGVSLLDFNSFPLRIKEVPGQHMAGELQMGYLDALYGRSKGCRTPSGWTCESLPYLVEFDNFGISDQPGKANLQDHYIWGYDEISWFYQQDRKARIEWLKYADRWVEEHDKNGFLEMPGSRIVSLKDGRANFRAYIPTEHCTDGLDLEGIIKEIWNNH